MRFLMALALAGAVAAPLSAQIANHVVINEFVYDDTSTDDREFVELHNPTGSPVDISGWFLEGADEAYPADNNADYTIPPGTMIPAGGFYVIGSSNLGATAQLQPGATNLWENGSTSAPGGESIVLWDADPNINANAAIIDAVTYESNKHLVPGVAYPTQFQEGIGIWGHHRSEDAVPTSWARKRDGWDTDDNGADFLLREISPGASNNLPAVAPIFETFDALGAGSTVNGFHASFLRPQVVDPTIPGTLNPNAVPPSPQGGLAMSCMKTTGGGHAVIYSGDATADMFLECYVWVYASHATNDFEVWSIGMRGTTGTFHNPVDPLGQTNSNTGVCWRLVSDAVLGTTLSLVEEQSGGNVENVLTQIPITAGVNDGWQRLRLHVHGCAVDAHFGGTFGNVADGIRFTGVIPTTTPGDLYFGFRESAPVSGTVNAQGLLIDNLSIAPSPGPPNVLLVCLSQPLGPGTIQLDNFGLLPGAETWNLLTVNEACPGGLGTGPFGGLCTAAPQFSIIPILNMPNPTIPFHYTAAQSTLQWAAPGGIPSGLHIEIICVQAMPGGAIAISPAAAFDTL